MNTQLFQDQKGQIYTTGDMLKALQELGADKANVLYIHTDIGFGRPLAKRKELLQKLYLVLTSLGVKTLILPTYTFSFCNNQDFDVHNSKTTMGMLNEFVRNQDGVFRTSDPLMSVCVAGEVPSEYHNLSKISCGKGSTFEIMSKSDDNMFLFFGAKPTECFTYIHYIEAIYGVPYRYDRKFTGNVTDNGQTSKQEYILCALYDTVVPYVKMSYQNRLEEKGILKKLNFAQGELMLIKGKSAFNESVAMLDEDINVFLARPYDAYELGTSYVYGNVNSVK